MEISIPAVVRSDILQENAICRKGYAWVAHGVFLTYIRVWRNLLTGVVRVR